MQHAAMFDVFDLDRGIDPAFQVDVFHSAVGHCDGAGHHFQRFDRVETRDRHRFLTC